jgi:DNA-binding transcriptional LysR family regulator
MDHIETRELRYFIAVAEELHFGRAAARLGIAQPPLSRAIRRLEHRMGVTLLERTSRRARLTVAGEVLLTEARTALEAVAAATRRAQRAGAPLRRLVLTMKPGGDAGAAAADS